MQSRIPVFKPSIDEREIEAVRKVLESGWLGPGPKREEFEEAFAKYIGCRYAVAVSSGTAALHLALIAAGAKGHFVITTPLTFVSTALAIVLAGAIPIFADIEPDTLNMDPNIALMSDDGTMHTFIGRPFPRRSCNKKIFILPVHYGGHPCEMHKIMMISIKNEMPIIEDCAHACGASSKEFIGDHKAGTFGLMGCFSFNAVKNMTTGEGGMITTNRAEFYEKLKRLRWCGIDKDTWERKSEGTEWNYGIQEVGYKYQMSDINAAVGLVQLSKLDEMNKKRELRWRLYNSLLSKESEIELPVVKDYALPSYHNYVIKVDGRDDLHAYLTSQGIDSSVHYRPLNHYPIFHAPPERTPVAEAAWPWLLTLPLYPDLEEGQVAYICDRIHLWLLMKSQASRIKSRIKI